MSWTMTTPLPITENNPLANALPMTGHAVLAPSDGAQVCERFSAAEQKLPGAI